MIIKQKIKDFFKKKIKKSKISDINEDLFFKNEDIKTEIINQKNALTIDELAYDLYLIDYNAFYYRHDRIPASIDDIINHHNLNKKTLEHEYDPIDEYYDKANIILRKKKIENLNEI